MSVLKPSCVDRDKTAREGALETVDRERASQGARCALVQLGFLMRPPLVLLLWSVFASCAQAQRACNDASVTHEVFSPNGYPGNTRLTAQTMREIPKQGLQQARDRRIPYESRKIEADLQWEYQETEGFLDKTLKKDPRLKPDDIIVTTDHMTTCTSCVNYDGLHVAHHPNGPVDFGTQRQILVDDWPVESWTNIVRFLNTPDEQQPVLETRDDDNQRFGCPCSVLPTQSPMVPLQEGGTPDGGEYVLHARACVQAEDVFAPSHAGVILVHSAGPREGDNVNRYRARYSRNRVSEWTSGQWVTIDGIDTIGTFTGMNTKSLPLTLKGQPQQWKFLAGYEGYQGEACLATSADGITWSTLNSRGDHADGGNNDDDDDEWTKDHRCYGSSDSFLRRAADAYVVPVVVRPSAHAAELRRVPTHSF